MDKMVNVNEDNAAKAFSKQAAVFDQYDAGNTIIQYKRRRVRERVERDLAPDSAILRIECRHRAGLPSISRPGAIVYMLRT